MQRVPRVVTLDIETVPHLSYHWQVWGVNVAPTQMVSPTYMVAYAYSVNGGPVTCRFAGDALFYDDLYKTLTNADLLVTFNGEKFDMQHIRRELLEQGFLPLRPVASVDLYKHVKSTYKFPYNRLDYVAGVLLGEHKLDTGGFELWKGVMDGDQTAIRKMARYNKRDVRLTERLYKRLRAYIKNHPFVSGDTDIPDAGGVRDCPACLHKWVEAAPKFVRYTRCYTIRQHQCPECGHWHDGKRVKRC